MNINDIKFLIILRLNVDIAYSQKCHVYHSGNDFTILYFLYETHILNHPKWTPKCGIINTEGKNVK